ncbi:DUF1934 domain-containing protein [Clostridium magnum]|uniref:Putative beta-barrel protein YwiB n=1 Tax=Clostridium magnum DSM 2767 TaxID=1121326 RepID=A0A161X7G3_9CLOT|nr:DUF1934 domain-containing protein [Clostridium magnum]KZL90066.1 putative beta-barrel protein YwiB [Clostridium magnum DSM 2767]SHH59222.1 Uncharacterized beta-barrel protein YwiB, DUF1934 family [Clostridium magnum DSM 2767]
MKQKAIISVSSKQSIDEEELIEVVTPGNFYKKENYYYAVYEETELSGMRGTTTTLKIGKDKFSLIRMGSTSAKMDFDKKTKNVSMYNTPYGTLELKIETKDLDIDINDNGGSVMVNYNMSLSGQTPYNTMLKISIKAQE